MRLFDCVPVLAAVASLAGCASHPAPQVASAAPSRVAEVPMYSQEEWSQMNTDTSIPELAPNSVEAHSLSSSTSGGNYLPTFRNGGRSGFGFSGSTGNQGASAPSTSLAPSSSPSTVNVTSSIGHSYSPTGGGRGHR